MEGVVRHPGGDRNGVRATGFPALTPSTNASGGGCLKGLSTLTSLAIAGVESPKIVPVTLTSPVRLRTVGLGSW
eukprot:1586430-Heterocapsa_arctica.AAC.1